MRLNVFLDWKKDIFTRKVTDIQEHVCLYVLTKEIIMKSCCHVIYLGFYFHDKMWHRNVLLGILETFSCSVGHLCSWVGLCTHVLLTLLWWVSKCTR